MDLEERVAQLEKIVEELKESNQPKNINLAQKEDVFNAIKNKLRYGAAFYDLHAVENPRVAFEKVLPNGTKVVGIDGPASTVGKFIEQIRN